MGEIIKQYEGKIFKLLDRLPIQDEIVPAYTKQKRFETSVENIPKRFGVGTGFLKTLTKFLAKSEVGKYPKEYKPRIHGPYYPSRYYGTGKFQDCPVILDNNQCYNDSNLVLQFKHAQCECIITLYVCY